VQISLLKLAPGVRLKVGIERSGFDVIIGTDSKIRDLVNASATLTLRWGEMAVIVTITALTSIAVHFRHAIAASRIVSIWAANNLVTAAAIVSALVLLTGCVLAYWKAKQLFVYGVWELVFGTWSAFQAALALWPNGETAKFVGLASSLYVVSRGAGNVQKAFEEEAQRINFKLEPGDVRLWPFR
jgi:hypothetical protein